MSTQYLSCWLALMGRSVGLGVGSGVGSGIGSSIGLGAGLVDGLYRFRHRLGCRPWDPELARAGGLRGGFW